MNHNELTPGTIVTIPGEYLAVVQYVTPTWPYLANVAVAADQGLEADEITISVDVLDPALCWCGQPADGCTRMGKSVCAAHATDGWERLNGEDSFPPANDCHAGSVVDEVTANLIDMANRFRIASNAADGIHAVQCTGHAYGDAHTALMNLLRRAYGIDAAEVHEVMIDSYVTHAEAAEHVATQRAANETRLDVDGTTYRLILESVGDEFTLVARSLGGRFVAVLDEVCDFGTEIATMTAEIRAALAAA